MDLVLSIAAIVLGLIALERGADHFTEAVGALARRLRASEGTVGLITAGGEWEELVVVALAVFGGHNGLAIGNIVGACLANLVGSMPLGFFGREPLVPDRSARVYGAVMMALTVLVAGLATGGSYMPLAGGLLVGLFVVYLASVVVVIRKGWLVPPSEEDEGRGATGDETAEKTESAKVLVTTVILSLAVIAAAAEAIVLGSVHIAEKAGLSQYAIGATVVAIGTTLPDKAISFVGGRRGQSGIVTSNALGSNIFLLTLVLGFAALASGSGLAVTPSVQHVDLPLLVAASALVLLLFRRPSLHWRTGLVLLALYVSYIAFVFARG